MNMNSSGNERQVRSFSVFEGENTRRNSDGK